ncbi:hypothetical protein STA3757_24280 [Stanieria sp. NIES-3757]|nr:hypothetical protein STA3757_24280 [Stanieria sp. NIES-3757]
MCSLCALTNRYQQFQKSNLSAFDPKNLSAQITQEQPKTNQVILLKGRSSKLKENERK